MLATLDASHALAGVRFALADYMPNRLALEARMHAELVERGGRPETLSFTYPDSMTSYRLAEGSWPQSERCAKPCNGRLFLLDELPELLSTYGHPRDLYRTDPVCRYDDYVEAQLWCRPPVEQGSDPGS